VSRQKTLPTPRSGAWIAGYNERSAPVAASNNSKRRGEYRWYKHPLPNIPDAKTYQVERVSRDQIRLQLAALDMRVNRSPQAHLAMLNALTTNPGFFEAPELLGVEAALDGDERTGWTVEYFHIAAQDSVKAGTIVQPGSLIGHPSCEGFWLNAPATHLHLARLYNGEWITGDCWACAPDIPVPPFVMSGWTIKGYPGQVYDGWMERQGQIRQAEQGRDKPDNQISW